MRRGFESHRCHHVIPKVELRRTSGSRSLRYHTGELVQQETGVTVHKQLSEDELIHGADESLYRDDLISDDLLRNF